MSTPWPTSPRRLGQHTDARYDGGERSFLMGSAVVEENVVVCVVVRGSKREEGGGASRSI
jgi:hypothetical protein